MAEEVITEAPGNESGADENAGVLSVEDLANSFAERVEAEAEGEPTETEAKETDSEVESAEAAEVEDDVLRQSVSQEDDDEQEDEAEGESEEEESSEEEPAAESPAVGRLLKQIHKLTARAKGSEETVEAMKAEIATLKSQPEDAAQVAGSPALDDVKTLKDLEKVRQEAMSAKKWAMQHLGKDFVESGGQEYDGDQIREIFAAADEYLMEKIPARSQFLQSRHQWQADALTTFPWLESQEGELYDLYLQIRGGDQYAAILDALPNGDFVGATLARGIKATQDDQAATKKPKKTARAKPPPSQEGDAAPPVQSKQARKAAKKNKALGKGVISEGQLAAFLTD